MSQCAVGLWIAPGSVWHSQGRCHEPAVFDRMYCKQHLAEAMARVAMVTDGDKVRPWSGVIRASRMELRHTGKPVMGASV